MIWVQRVRPEPVVGDDHIGLVLANHLDDIAAQAEVLMTGPTSSGASSEKIAFVRATGLRRVGPGGGEGDEDITVHEVPRAQAAAWLAARLEEGYELDAKLWAGLWMIDHNLDGTPRVR